MKSQTLEHVQAVSQDWIWGDVIPAGAVTLISGSPGVGKSYLMLSIAAQVTRGIRGPLVDRLQPSICVLLCLGDDDLTKTVRPRLDASGARPDCVFVFSTSTLTDSEAYVSGKPNWECHLLNLTEETERLRITGTDIRMILIDPVESFFGDDDDRKGQSRLAAELAQFATRTGLAVVCLSDQFAPDSSRPVGSGPSCYSKLAKVARSIWIVKQDPNELDRRRLVPVKTNLCQPSGYPTAAIGEGIQWGLEQITPAHPTRQSELRRAMAWAKMQLDGRTILTEDLLRSAFRAGIAERTLRRAMTMIDCVNVKDERTGKGGYRMREKPTLCVRPLQSKPASDPKEMDDAETE